MFRSLAQRIRTLEEVLLSVLLTAMILLSCVQIVLRIFFDNGLAWADPLLRYLVVWSGFLGAVLAVSQGKHISLDISGYFLPDRFKRVFFYITHSFSCIFCCFLSYAAVFFIKSEIAFGGAAFLNIPTWGWNLIFPIAFALMAVKYCIELFHTPCDSATQPAAGGISGDKQP